MKLPITDQLLWDIYGALNSIEDRGRLFIHTPRKFQDIILDVNDPIYQKYHKILNRKQFSKLVYWLKKNNYIKVKNLEGKKAMMLTKDGIGKAIRAGFKLESQKKQKRKDKKWIMIIFDIPKQDERKRGILRSILQGLGYKMFQKSVWITPYDVFEKTENLLQFYSLDSYVKIFLIKEIM